MGAVNLKVSIIVPMYKVAPFIEKCVRSILAQTYDNLEVILVNDGSPDETLEIVTELCASDSRVKIITQANSGVNLARYTGFKNSTGDYITFVDGDDWIAPDMVEVMAGIAQEYGVDYVKSNYMWEAETSIPINNDLVADVVLRDHNIDNYLFLKMLTNYYLNPLCTQLIRRKMVDNEMFDAIANITVAEDVYFNAMLLKRVDSFYFTPKHLYHYNRLNAGSVTQNTDYFRLEKNVVDCFLANAKILEIVSKFGDEHKRIGCAKLLFEMGAIVDRLMRSEMLDDHADARTRFLTRHLNQEFFHQIKEVYTFEQICLGSKYAEICRLIYDQDVDGIKRLYET